MLLCNQGDWWKCLLSIGGQTVDTQMDLIEEHDLIDLFILIFYQKVKMHLYTTWPHLALSLF